jgi:NAD(P)-dependent dehydrogenase (short-subunit alcohol dehydrogenase family)
MLEDQQGKVVLITGGTKGIGLACGLAFGRLGAKVYLTHRWGSADEGELRAKFEAAGASAPVILEADASQRKETKALMGRIAEQEDGVDIFISNVCVVMRGDGVDSHNRRALLKSLDYSAWPFVDYLHQIHGQFGRYPEYAVAMSSDGPDTHYPGYDYVAVAKAVLETFVRYMSTHLREEGVKVNALRTRQVVTESYTQIFGEENVGLAEQFAEFACTPEEVADTTVALCSGMLDAMSGQVISLDRGAAFVDNMMTLGHRMNTKKSPATDGGEAS